MFRDFDGRRWALLPPLFLAAFGCTSIEVDGTYQGEALVIRSGYVEQWSASIVLHLASVPNLCRLDTLRHEAHEADEDMTVAESWAEYYPEDFWLYLVFLDPADVQDAVGSYEDSDEAVNGVQMGAEHFWAHPPEGLTPFEQYVDIVHCRDTEAEITAYETGGPVSGSLSTDLWEDSDDDGLEEDIGNLEVDFRLKPCSGIE